MPKKSGDDGGVLVNAAQAIGKAAGKIAALAGAEATAPKQPKKRIAKLQKKDKPHLPRRIKKAQKKAHSSSST